MANRKLTDIELERQLAGDLPQARFAEATDDDRARLAELRTEQEAFLRSIDVDMEVKRIHQRVERMTPERRSWLRWLVPASALAAAAAVILVVIRRGHDTTPAHRADDDLQVKGDDISLVIHLATETGSKRLTSGDPVHPGDRIRFEVDAMKPGFVAIIGVDGTGEPSVYFPDNSAQAPAHYEPATRLLPGAIQLDATPGDEHFYAVYSERTFAIGPLLPMFAAHKPLPPGFVTSEVTLAKK